MYDVTRIGTRKILDFPLEMTFLEISEIQNIGVKAIVFIDYQLGCKMTRHCILIEI